MIIFIRFAQKIIMGKKKVISQSAEEVIKETEKIEQAVKKEPKISSKSVQFKDGRVYISSSYNNTIMTLTDSKGKVLACKSAGAVGFKGTKKSTSFAASRVAETIVNLCRKLTMENISVFVKGIGAGRESAIRTLAGQGMNIIAIKDITPIPHNGCRPRKVRRV